MTNFISITKSEIVSKVRSDDGESTFIQRDNGDNSISFILSVETKQP